MQAACNCTIGMHPFDFDASSMAAQAHTSCNRRAGYYVRKTAPPLAPVSRLLDCGTGAATQGNPAHSPTVPTRRIGHGSVTAGEGATVNMAKSGPTVMVAAGGRKQQSNRLQAHVPSWSSRRALSHGVKTTRPCSVPRTARACTTAAPRTTRPVALTPRQGRRHLWQAKRATLHLHHNDRIKKVCHIVQFCILFLFPFLSLATGTGKGDTPKGILLYEGRGPRALLLIRGSKADPSKGFDNRLRALGLRAHYWSEVRRLALGRVRQLPQATRAPRPLLIRGS
jgi:hypothetical protein